MWVFIRTHASEINCVSVRVCFSSLLTLISYPNHKTSCCETGNCVGVQSLLHEAQIKGRASKRIRQICTFMRVESISQHTSLLL